MMVDVPSSLNSQSTSKSLKGNDIYQSLRGFVWIGEVRATLINDLCTAVQKYNLTTIKTVTFTGSDGLSKTLTVTANPTINGTVWDWEVIVTDQDGSKALEFYWNASPVKGVAIYQAYKLNHTDVFQRLIKMQL